MIGIVIVAKMAALSKGKVETHISCIGRRVLTTHPLGSPHIKHKGLKNTSLGQFTVEPNIQFISGKLEVALSLYYRI